MTYFNGTTNRYNTLKASQQVGKVMKGNSKVHGSTFSVDPTACKVGAKLVNVEGSTCSGCYAIKLGKLYKSAQQSWENNLSLWIDALATDPLAWIESMVYQINHIANAKHRKGEQGAGYHRWFAAGDLPNMDALRAIVAVAQQTPHINHWLPTREKGLVSQYLATHLEGFPANLTVRLSAAMVDGAPALKGANTSTVHTKGQSVHGMACPAYENGGSCGDCTACWNGSVANISYQKH